MPLIEIDLDKIYRKIRKKPQKSYRKHKLAKQIKENYSGKTSSQARTLFYALKEKGINCELEAYDGKKHVDISIPEAKLNIEIDGLHHSINPEQLSVDLQRDEYSALSGFSTKRYTNKEIEEHLEEIVDALVKVVEQRKRK
jgi:very-short-patch-repair endonuclease